MRSWPRRRCRAGREMPFWIAVTENVWRKTRETSQAIFLHHIRACKHPAGFFIGPPARELRIDDGVFNRGMADPILDKAEIRARIQEVGGNRGLEDMKMSLGGRDSGQLAIVFHQGIELPAGNRRPALRKKERGGVTLPLTQGDLQSFNFIRAEGIDPFQGS